MKNYKYCPYCGSPNTKHKEYFDCQKCGKKVFLNSPPAVGVILVKDDKVFLTMRKFDPKKGFYDYPGGFLNLGENPKNGAIREIKEELDIDIEIIDLLGLYINNDYIYQGENKYPLDAIYIAKITSGNIKYSDDVVSGKWFELSKLPPMAFDHQNNVLEDYQNWYAKQKTIKTGN